ncbi:hypothetical protein Anapl_13907 [Anas platyrhynchos]|uniref:Uncharacterized protein n=1 Tax=Anas platyrhynchos TaxID=8839 RepID=R0JDU0_ANAPL|nr:hypothetical protein Anapl_13907 [Anas platyrhynchos]
MGTATKIQHPGGGSEGLPRASPCPDQARGRDGVRGPGDAQELPQGWPWAPSSQGMGIELGISSCWTSELG